MKKRGGFVSNSSSSSYIVILEAAGVLLTVPHIYSSFH